MILVGQFFDFARIHPVAIGCEIDADRKATLFRDEVSGAYGLKLTNGTKVTEVAFTPEAAAAVFGLLEVALTQQWPSESGEVLS